MGKHSIIIWKSKPPYKATTASIKMEKSNQSSPYASHFTGVLERKYKSSPIQLSAQSTKVLQKKKIIGFFFLLLPWIVENYNYFHTERRKITNKNPEKIINLRLFSRGKEKGKRLNIITLFEYSKKKWLPIKKDGLTQKKTEKTIWKKEPHLPSGNFPSFKFSNGPPIWLKL